MPQCPSIDQDWSQMRIPMSMSIDIILHQTKYEPKLYNNYFDKQCDAHSSHSFLKHTNTDSFQRLTKWKEKKKRSQGFTISMPLWLA